jgi:hypothetical protein
MARDWIDYLPEPQRRKRQAQRRWLRSRQVLHQRRFWLWCCGGAYGVWCLGLLAKGNVLAFGLALIPLISMPALGWLAWWLVYKEFHN